MSELNDDRALPGSDQGPELVAVRENDRWMLGELRPTDPKQPYEVLLPDRSTRIFGRGSSDLRQVQPDSLLHEIAADPDGARDRFREDQVPFVVRLLREDGRPLSKSGIERRLKDLLLTPPLGWWLAVHEALKGHEDVLAQGGKFQWSGTGAASELTDPGAGGPSAASDARTPSDAAAAHSTVPEIPTSAGPAPPVQGTSPLTVDSARTRSSGGDDPLVQALLGTLLSGPAAESTGQEGPFRGGELDRGFRQWCELLSARGGLATAGRAAAAVAVALRLWAALPLPPACLHDLVRLLDARPEAPQVRNAVRQLLRALTSDVPWLATQLAEGSPLMSAPVRDLVLEAGFDHDGLADRWIRALHRAGRQDVLAQLAWWRNFHPSHLLDPRREGLRAAAHDSAGASTAVAAHFRQAGLDQRSLGLALALEGVTPAGLPTPATVASAAQGSRSTYLEVLRERLSVDAEERTRARLDSELGELRRQLTVTQKALREGDQALAASRAALASRDGESLVLRHEERRHERARGVEAAVDVLERARLVGVEELPDLWQVASRAGLEVRYAPGETVPFDPAFQELTEYTGRVADGNRVNVVRPAYLLRGDGDPTLIRAALVEPL